MPCRRPLRVSAATLAALTLAFLLAPRAAAAEEEPQPARVLLPAGSASNAGGIPPYAPPRPPAGASLATRKDLALQWIAAAESILPRLEQQRATPDVLLACAFLWRDLPGRHDEAARDFTAARDAYPPAEPFRAVASLELARLELARGHPAAALRHRETLTRFDNSTGLLNPSALDQLREGATRRYFDLHWPRAEAQMLAGMGKLEAAGLVLERGAVRLSDPRLRARRLERAARFYTRAGQPTRAVAAIDAASRDVASEDRQADLAFWRLHIEHGVVDAGGSPALTSTWPGRGFTQRVLAYLDRYGHLPSTAEQYLAFGSLAHTAGRDEIALEIYHRALANPHLESRFRSSASLQSGLLVMVPVAIELQRYSEAQRFLDALTRMGAGSQELRDALEIRLREARAAKEERTGEPTSTAPPAPPCPRRGASSPGARCWGTAQRERQPRTPHRNARRQKSRTRRCPTWCCSQPWCS